MSVNTSFSSFFPAISAYAFNVIWVGEFLMAFRM